MKNEKNPELYPQWDMVTYHTKPKIGRKMDSRSMTIPDQSLSLQQILERYTRGMPLPTIEASYDEDEIPDVRTMDLSERMDMARQFSQELQQINDRQEANEATKKANELRQQIRDELQKELESQNPV